MGLRSLPPLLLAWGLVVLRALPQAGSSRCGDCSLKDAHSWDLSCRLGAAQPSWVSLGISISKMPEGARFSELPGPPSHFLGPRCTLCWEEQNPSPPVCGDCPWWGVRLSHPGGSFGPLPSLRDSPRSFPDTTPCLQASNCLGSPPMGSPEGRDVSLAPAWGTEGGVGSPDPPILPVYLYK